MLYFTPIHPVYAHQGRNNADGGAGRSQAVVRDWRQEGRSQAIHSQLGTRELPSTGGGLPIMVWKSLSVRRVFSGSPVVQKQHRAGSTSAARSNTRKTRQKKYQDIVNVDFYAPDAIRVAGRAARHRRQLGLEGVNFPRRQLRKPLPFWQWLIADIARCIRSDLPRRAFTTPGDDDIWARLGTQGTPISPGSRPSWPMCLTEAE